MHLNDGGEIWQSGREAGVEYFNCGVLSGMWEYPDASPFEEGCSQDYEWWDGFSFGVESAEVSQECD
jgi:hypothetical protein